MPTKNYSKNWGFSSIVVVNADPRVLRHTEALLTEQGYLVAASSSFPEGRKLLDSVMPDLLIADLSLGRLDGLQLAIESQRDHPDVPVIVTFSGEDTVPDPTPLAASRRSFVSPSESPVSAQLDKPLSSGGDARRDRFDAGPAGR